MTSKKMMTFILQTAVVTTFLAGPGISGEKILHPLSPVNAPELAISGRIVGYLPEYRLDQLNYIDFSKLTNVVYFALAADDKGNLVAGNPYLNGLPLVMQAAQAKGAKVSACVGGWETDKFFSPIAGSAVARANFIHQLLNFCLAHHLDGIDLDWEPVANSDVPNYSTLLKELRPALSQHGLLLSVAVSSSHYDIDASAFTALDWIGVMTYDMNWPHADHSSFGDTIAAMDYWGLSGASRQKLLLGIPFYGSNEGWGSNLTYAEIVDRYNPDPSENCVGGYCYNGLDLVRDKTNYACRNGFGGIMIWELGQDNYDTRSLLATISRQAEEDYQIMIWRDSWRRPAGSPRQR